LWERLTIAIKQIRNGVELTGKAEQLRGTALREASVILTNESRSYRTSAKHDGSFHFSAIEPGLYTLRVVQSGFVDFVLEGVRTKEGHKTEISDSLQLPRCPRNVKCTPVRTVPKNIVCL
jgi:hypothetical protein